jgi:hypothetical protein
MGLQPAISHRQLGAASVCSEGVGLRLMGQSAAGRGCPQKAGRNITELVIRGLIETRTGRFHGLSGLDREDDMLEADSAT